MMKKLLTQLENGSALNYYGSNNGSSSAYVTSYSIDKLDKHTNVLKKYFHTFSLKTNKMPFGSIPPVSIISDYEAFGKPNEIKDHLTSLHRAIIENGIVSLSPPKPPFCCSGEAKFSPSFFAVDLKIEHKPKLAIYQYA